MPLSPELERLKQAAASDASDEAGILADAAAELETTAKAVAAYAAFSRAAGIDPAAVIAQPEATAQAFSRELNDLKAAQSALPKLDGEVAHERRLRVRTALNGLGAKGYQKAVIDELEPLLVGTAAKPNVAMLSRDEADADIQAMRIIDVLAKHGPPPPTGQLSAGREVPRQAPAGGGKTEQQLIEEGRAQAKAFADSTVGPKA